MTKILDLKRPYDKLGNSPDPDYVRQDGAILCWSESNTRYEEVWWLTPEGRPIASRNPDHVANILRDRPFDPAWLEMAA